MSRQLISVFINSDGAPTLTVNAQGRVYRWTLTDDALKSLAHDVVETISKRAKAKLAAEKLTE